ncbi:MAG: serine--tRNA ligase [Bdellovibrionota bacterium]
MLDWRRIVKDEAAFVKALESRSVESSKASDTFQKISQVSKKRSEALAKADQLKAERNQSSQAVSQMMKAGQKTEAQALIQKGKELGSEIERIEAEANGIESEFTSILEMVPNMPDASVPVGKSEKDNPVIRSWGEPRKFSFQPRTHDSVGEKLGLLDFDRASKISGARFAFLRGPLAQLERALASFMLDLHRPKGYQEINPPYLVSAETMYGMGQFPKFKEDVFGVAGQDKFLIPTSEVPVTSFYRDEILAEEELPIKFMAFSPCFRSEAGSYGRDTKGLIRQHQFHKVELVKFAHPDTSLQELESMVADAELVLKKLEIPFRTILLCTGDMGFNSRKTYDIEVWLPGSMAEGDSKTLGCYREISSCSDCGDFQARRAQIRFKGKASKSTQYVHTLNGSGLAVGRTLVAVLENYQQEDGSVVIPEVLRPYMGGLAVIQ